MWKALLATGSAKARVAVLPVIVGCAVRAIPPQTITALRVVRPSAVTVAVVSPETTVACKICCLMCPTDHASGRAARLVCAYAIDSPA
jgi:hypothetical protein